ncbi:Tumor protein p53-inducible nuclear protein 1 [Dryobates pubescens]|uniref:Tumor protein p53-inducible nuclear protein 1 n=1 Tax=Dryobates pubescens TaxID=118200 RepID=A0A093GIY1_DRYPU|nr:Tumor protein p53-inducible nuclear protein 1 [Dryobates pubescens]
MFQRLNNMLMGEIDSLSSQEPEFSEKEDDEWILVDFIDACTNCAGEEANAAEAAAADGSPVFSCLPSPLEHLPEASESCFIQFESCPMEESWFITPPPCFTAGGLTTIKVETSPMENLLIEHPSMSVYAVHDTCHGLNETGCGDEEFHSPGSPRAEAPSDAGQRLHCYVAALAAGSAALEKSKSLRPAHWIREHHERHHPGRSGLRRHNLARDCHPRPLKHSGLFVHQPCQRPFNY